MDQARGGVQSVLSSLGVVSEQHDVAYHLEIDGLSGIFGSRLMPEAMRSRIAADVAAICRETEIRRKLEAGGHIVQGGTADELKAGIERQRSAMRGLARLIDIRNPQ